VIELPDNVGTPHALIGGFIFVFGVVLLLIVMVGAHSLSGGDSALPARVLLLVFILIAAVNYLVRRDVLYPACMFSLVWCLSMAVYELFPYEIDPIRWPTVFIFLSGALSFSLGCAFGARPIGKGRTWFTEPSGNAQFRNFLLLCCAAMVPFSAYHTMRLAGMSAISPAMFVAARQAVVDLQTEGLPGSTNVFLSMAPTVSVSTAFLLILEEKRKWIVSIGICVAILLGLFTTGRSIWMLLFCGWMILSLLRAPSRSITKVGSRAAAAALLITLALTAVTLLTKKETQGEASGEHSALGMAAGLTAAYVAGPLAGFNFVVENPATFRDQSNGTFAPILSPLRGVGLRYDPPPPFEPFLPVPFLFNVFTAYKTFFVDFGATGCSLALLLCGAISGSLFDSAVRGNKFAAFALCYVGLAVIFTPFMNAFILFNRYAYVALFGIAYFVVIPRLPRITLFRIGKHVKNRCQ
jgi:oligosaccharide repeat unit polymerase